MDFRAPLWSSEEAHFYFLTCTYFYFSLQTSSLSSEFGNKRLDPVGDSPGRRSWNGVQLQRGRDREIKKKDPSCFASLYGRLTEVYGLVWKLQLWSRTMNSTDVWRLYLLTFLVLLFLTWRWNAAVLQSFSLVFFIRNVFKEVHFISHWTRVPFTQTQTH